MIVVDTNILLYAYDSTSEHHERAKDWVERAFSGPEAVRLPWVVLLGFLRITTHHKVFSTPLTMKEAASIVDAWLACPSVAIAETTEWHWSTLAGLLDGGAVRGALVTDAHIAAVAIEHGARLCTNDDDFRRFPGVDLLFPLRR